VQDVLKMEILLQISCSIGLIISIYFLAIYKGWVKGNKLLVPTKVCSKNTCGDALNTSYARVFGVPNFVFGILYYICIILLTIFAFDKIFWLIAVVVSWIVVIFSAYLANSLIRVLKIHCLLCFMSHLINLTIAIAITLIIF